jgi:hypothetical protein
MKVTDQYAHLVEKVANARVLAALGDDSITSGALEVKRIGVEMAASLGVSKTDFDADTIARYFRLINAE